MTVINPATSLTKTASPTIIHNGDTVTYTITASNAGQPHGISGHWNNVHRMLNELKWFDTYLKNGGTTSAGR